MASRGRFRAVMGAVLVALGTPGAAYAAGPTDVELALKAGYTSNSYAFDLGGRVGIAYRGAYLGGTLLNYFGDGGSAFTTTFIGGAEVGYGFKVPLVVRDRPPDDAGFSSPRRREVGLLTLRPLVGFDGATYQTCASHAGGFGPPPKTCTAGSFILLPGCLVQFTFGQLMFGVDGGALIPARSPAGLGTSALGYTAFSMNGEVGARF